MTGDIPVVFVPGMLCDEQLWEHVQPGPGFRTVHGAIDAPSIARMAEQVLGAVDGPFVTYSEVVDRASSARLGECAAGPPA